MIANMLKQHANGKVYVDLTEDSLIEEDDAELLALEYQQQRGPDHVGYLILNPRSWQTTEVFDEHYRYPTPF